MNRRSRPNRLILAGQLRPETRGRLASREIGAMHTRLVSDDIVVRWAGVQMRSEIVQQRRRQCEIRRWQKDPNWCYFLVTQCYANPQGIRSATYSEVDAKKKGEVSRNALAVAAPSASRPNPLRCILSRECRYMSPLDTVRRLMVPGPAPMMLAPGGYSPLGGGRVNRRPARQFLLFLRRSTRLISRLSLYFNSKHKAIWD